MAATTDSRVAEHRGDADVLDRTELAIDGMNCPSCAVRIERALTRSEGAPRPASTSRPPMRK